MAVPDRAPLEGFLQRLLLRSELNGEERGAILALEGSRLQVAAHQDFVAPGETVDYCCLMVDGLTARFDQMRDGSRQINSLYIPGDMCDLQSAVWPTAAWGISALSPSTMLRIPHAALRALAMRFPAILLAFWRDNSADAGVLAKWVGNIGRKDTRARVAHLLCEMGRRMQEAGLGTRESYMLRATQEQLGDTMGLTPVHINRTLQALRSEGAVSFRSFKVEVPDLNLLASIAEFDPRFLQLESGDIARAH